MKEILFENNIKSLEYQVVNINNYNKINIIYPVILKCDNLGSSIGIEVCNNNDEYIKACHKLFLYDDYILIEPYLTDFIEYNIACKKKVEGIVLSNIEEIKKNDLIYSFNEKYKNNNINKIINPDIDEKIKNKLKEITLKVYDLFELDYVCRFDFILKENILYLNEINNIPGSLSYYLFNQSIDEHIHDLIKIKLYKINNNHKLNIKSNLLEYKSSSK
jgi:D-alanine-D-alanine ligase